MAKRRHVETDRNLTHLEDIPNVGPAIAGDLRRLGVKEPEALIGRDPFAMYEKLCRITGRKHDPCLLDVFIAAVRFMEGAPAKPWWKYTAERKREMAERGAGKPVIPFVRRQVRSSL
ncbi:MAG: mitomycin resistance protein [Proteobacteria bacterium]|nr:MAG: mitomycin resistance protein [Pseudomonadota bacterium]